MPTHSNPLAQIPDNWKFNSNKNKIKRTFTFKNFLEAFMFVARIAVHAEVLQHHPDIQLSYGKVIVTLTTHEVNAITKKDIALATRINSIEQ